MNNQIKNPKVEVTSGLMLNDKDYVNSLLAILKDIVKNYAIFITEASNKYLYDKYEKMLLEYSALQRKTFEVMFAKGWYVLEKADDTKIQSEYQKLNQEFISLNN